MKQKIIIQIVTELDNHLISAWKTLWKEAKNANFYNSYEWHLASQKTFPDTKNLYYLAYQGKKLVAILPLEKCKVFGIPAFGSFNTEFIIETGFLMKTYDKDIFKTLFAEVFRNKNIFLQKIDSEAALILHNLFPNTFLSIMSVNPMLELTNDPFAQTSQSTLTQVKRLERKYKDQMRHTAFTTDLEKHFDEILALQKYTSKHIKAMDIFEDKTRRDYYRNITKYCSDRIRIDFLYYDKKLIGYIYSVFSGGRLVGEQIAYHNEYRKTSPGKMMVYFLIKDLKEKKFEMLDMGGGITPYKMSFTKEYRFLYNLHASPNMFVLMWWKLINGARRVKQLIMPQKHSYDHQYLFKKFTKEQVKSSYSI